MATANLLGFTLTLTPPLVVALRIGPLLSATASLTHAYMEYLTNSCFLHPAPIRSSLSGFILGRYEPTSTSQNIKAMDEARAKVVPAWFVDFFNRAVRSVIGFNSMTLLLATTNLYLFPDGLGQQRNLYVVGLTAAAAHYAFVPLVMPSVERLFLLCAMEEKGDEAVNQGRGAVECVREWVGYHIFRMCTVDTVAWICFALGAVQVLGVDKTGTL